jgi:transposase
MAVSITRTELSARELRAAAAKTTDAKAARRILAIALVMDGMDRGTAAESCGMDRQTLRDRVHRYNAEGLAGLSNRRSAGPKPRLSAEQKAELAQMVREGPDPAVDGVVRWRRIDLKRRIEARFGVKMHERTVGKQLAGLGFHRLSVRPQHPKSDPEVQEAFKTYGPPRWQVGCFRLCSVVHKRIRRSGALALAMMEIRASWSS